jgi:hypothetical protein
METWAAVVVSVAAVVVTKTMAVTAMVGAQKTINNQLNAAVVMAKETVTLTVAMPTTTMMAMAAAVAVDGSGNGKAGSPPSLPTNFS